MLVSVYVFLLFLIFNILGWIVNKRYHLLQSGCRPDLFAYLIPKPKGFIARLAMLLGAFLSILILNFSLSNFDFSSMDDQVCSPNFFRGIDIFLELKWMAFAMIIGSVAARYIVIFYLSAGIGVKDFSSDVHEGFHKKYLLSVLVLMVFSGLHFFYYCVCA